MVRVRRITTSHDQIRFAVTIPVALTGGERKQRFFKTKAKADKFLKEIESQRFGSTGAFSALPQSERVGIMRAFERTGHDVDKLNKAVDLWLSTPQLENSPALETAFKECLEAKAAGGKRPAYVKAMSGVLNSFGEYHGVEQSCASVKASDIDGWLTAQAWQPTTKEGAMRKLKTFLEFCRKRKWVAENVASGVERIRLDDKPPGILTVEECERLMRTVERDDPALAPFVAVMLFAGIRPAEALKLTWSEVLPDHIEVRAAKSKTRQRRLVTIGTALRAWLALPVWRGPFLGPWRGQLPVINYRRRLRAVKKAAGIPWPQDCLRHSFASYHLALGQSPDKTAHELGHRNTQMLFAHYRELVTKEQAEKFWAIMPTPA